MTIRKYLRCTRILTFLILTVLLPLVLALGQSQNQISSDRNQSNQEVIACALGGISLAMVEVEVTDKYGKAVDDLIKDDFTIYEDGVKQEMIYWKCNVGSDRRPEHPMYEMGYYTTNIRFDGAWRWIRVLVENEDERKLNVQFTPMGYYANEKLRKN